MKKITITILFMILLASTLSASMSQVLGWAISFKQGTLDVKALCAVSGPACEGAQFAINPGGYVQGEALGFLGEASPELGQAVSAVINPEGFVTQQALSEIAKENPEAAGGLGEALTVSDQLKTLGITDGRAEINKEGMVTKANFEIKKEGQIGNIIGEEIKKEEVTVKNVRLDKKDGITTLTIQQEGYAKVKDKLFMNVQDGGKLKLDEKGEVTEADFISTKSGTTYELGNKIIQVEEGTRLLYKSGVLEVFGEDKTITLDDQKITLNGDNSIKVDGQKITGKDFTIDEKNFRSVNRRDAEVTLVKEGYLLGKNTIMESDNLIITSKEENVLFSKTCQDTSNFDNYVNPCGKTLTMGGQLTTQLKEGKSFGLNIEKDDTLVYDMQGGKVTIENGESEIKLKQDTGIKITNGDMELTYEWTAEGIEVTTNPDSIDQIPDVELLITVPELGEDELWSLTTETTEEGLTAYHCPVTPSQTTATTTGMFTFKDLKEKCEGVVVSAKGKIDKKLEGYAEKQREKLEKERVGLEDGKILNLQKREGPYQDEEECENCNIYYVKTVDGKEYSITLEKTDDDTLSVIVLDEEEELVEFLEDEEVSKLIQQGFKPPFSAKEVPRDVKDLLPPGKYWKGAGDYWIRDDDGSKYDGIVIRINKQGQMECYPIECKDL
ncbi:MAG: hypothetical protein ISS23_00505 [Nanoarchaeota archaeon]|nr:hypothetical protein [Nanoarchaeota archaeon]